MDIGVNNPLGIQAIDIVSAHLKSMPALRPLVLVAKGFLRQRGLNDAAKGGLGSFALVCLCIHFLQVYPSPLSPPPAHINFGHSLFRVHIDEPGPPSPHVPDAPGRD